MKLTKSQIKQLIKEVLEEVSIGLGDVATEGGQPLENKEIGDLMQKATNLYSQLGPLEKKEITKKFEQAVSDWKAEQDAQGASTL